MRVVLKRAQHFITVNGKFYGAYNNPVNIRKALAAQQERPRLETACLQTSLFDAERPLTDIITGEL